METGAAPARVVTDHMVSATAKVIATVVTIPLENVQVWRHYRGFIIATYNLHKLLATE